MSEINRDEIEQFLVRHDKWSLTEADEGGQELYRRYEFPSYAPAVAFMNEISARAIESLDHHPRWQNNYNELEVWLTTHSAGGRLTAKDLQLARQFEQLWNEFKANSAPAE
jgi:4a-hydroxytetrahydrobiopterin dehydratase